MTAPPVVSRDALNRTLLQRQFLTERVSRPPIDVVRRVVALQAQEPNWPYVGLWTRVDGFRHEHLSALLEDRTVVRSTVLRVTQHLVAGDDFRWLRAVVQPTLDRHSRGAYYARQSAGVDLARLTAEGRALLGDRTVPRRELAQALSQTYPEHDGRILASIVELQVPLVHAPPTAAFGGWGTRGGISVTLADAWLDGEPSPEVDASDRLATMVRRYLAAFGPATVMDAQVWSGATRLKEVFDTMRTELRVLRDEHGHELFDLPDGELAPAHSPVPVRFLPAFDNVLLGHKDRTRVISDDDRREVMPGGAMVRPSFLVDGYVRGTWELDGSTLRVRPFRLLSDPEAAAVLDEAERLHSFVDRGASAPTVEIT
jgi:hypothetical protein